MSNEEWTKYIGCHVHSESCALYIVRNSTKKSQFVVAANADFARYLSFKSGHIRDLKNGIVRKVSLDWLNKDEPFRSALKQAASCRNPGVIVQVGNSAVIHENWALGIKGGVFQPISSV